MEALAYILTYMSVPLYVFILLAAGVNDLSHYRIPNMLPVMLAGLFVIAAMASPYHSVDWLNYLGAFVLVLVVGMGLWRFGILGAGDVKLLAAAAFWVGLRALPDFLLWVGLSGAAIVVLLLVVRRMVVWIGAGWSVIGRMELPRVLVTGEGIPYGVAIAAGGLYWLTAAPYFAEVRYLQPILGSP
jgi:prepilin peptidase CpaA